MDTESKPMNTRELTQAVSLLLEREEAREARRQRSASRRRRQKRRQMESRIWHLTRSVEVIKWCLIGITTVMALEITVLLVVVLRVQHEAERIKAEVQHIQREAEMIREKIRHPLETLGGMLGRQVDSQLGELLTPSDDTN